MPPRTNAAATSRKPRTRAARTLIRCSFSARSHVERVDALLPVSSVEPHDREPVERDVVEAADVHVDAIGMRAGNVEARNAARAAEMMLCDAGAEAIRRERIRARHEPERLLRDDVVQVALARANRAVALDDAVERGRHLEPH